MKKRKTNQMGLKAITVLVILLLLLAAPSVWAGDYNDGDTHDITIDEDHLNINTGATPVPGTTVNLYANILDYVVVGPGSFLNIYSGNVGSYIVVSTDSPSAVVTVYGTYFDGYSVPGEFSGSGILTGQYGNGSDIYLWFLTDTTIYLQLPDPEEEPDDELIIDIKPGSDENVINLKSNGVVPVAVLTTDELNAADLVPDYSISFADASPVHSTLEDVDNDGDEDLLFHFRTQELNLDETSTIATLTATLNSAVTKSSAATTGDVTEIKGSDKVKIKSSKK